MSCKSQTIHLEDYRVSLSSKPQPRSNRVRNGGSTTRTMDSFVNEPSGNHQKRQVKFADSSTKDYRIPTRTISINETIAWTISLNIVLGRIFCEVIPVKTASPTTAVLKTASPIRAFDRLPLLNTQIFDQTASTLLRSWLSYVLSHFEIRL